MAERKSLQKLIWIGYIAAGAVGIWLFVKFILPCIFPLLLALVTSRFIEPPVRTLVRKLHFRRSFAAFFCCTIFFALLLALIASLSARAVYELTEFIRQLPDQLSALFASFKNMDSLLDGYLDTLPEDTGRLMRSALDAVLLQAAELPATLSGKLLDVASDIAARSPQVLLFTATYAIGVYFISASYPQVIAFLLKQVPEKLRPRIEHVKHDLFDTVCSWVKAQLILMLVTFFELAVGFSLMRINYSLILAAVVALIDALPVLGTGTVLLPWAAFQLLSGYNAEAFALLMLYLFITLVRNCLEPHLLSSRSGVHPAAMLLALYAGFSAFGILGMILLPILLISAKQLKDRGYIRLWK